MFNAIYGYLRLTNVCWLCRIAQYSKCYAPFVGKRSQHTQSSACTLWMLCTTPLNEVGTVTMMTTRCLCCMHRPSDIARFDRCGVSVGSDGRQAGRFVDDSLLRMSPTHPHTYTMPGYTIRSEDFSLLSLVFAVSHLKHKRPVFAYTYIVYDQRQAKLQTTRCRQ